MAPYMRRLGLTWGGDHDTPIGGGVLQATTHGGLDRSGPIEIQGVDALDHDRSEGLTHPGSAHLHQGLGYHGQHQRAPVCEDQGQQRCHH